MLTLNSHSWKRTRGFSMIEVLITLVILAIGILGLAALMANMHQAEIESYQRVQAVLLLQDMTSRLTVSGNSVAAAVSPIPQGNVTYVTNYVTGTGSPLGTGDTQPSSCVGLATGAPLDKCRWSNSLKGAAEVSSANSNVGAMIGARGCIEQLQAFNTTPSICTPGIFRVTVTWQGLSPTAAQSGVACGQNLYGSNDALRRAISVNVTIGLPTC